MRVEDGGLSSDSGRGLVTRPRVAFLAFLVLAVGAVVLVAQSAPPRDWVTVGAEFAVAIGTVFLGWQTYGLVRETRQARVEAERLSADSLGRATHQREVDAFRRALLDVAETCRRWRSSNAMDFGPPAVDRIRGETLGLAGVDRLLRRVDLSADLTAELIWQLSYARQRNEVEVQQVIATNTSDPGLQDAWNTVFLSLTLVACLLRTEANRRGLTEIDESFRDIPWWNSMPRLSNPSEDADNQTRGRWGGPMRPNAYALCWTNRVTSHGFPRGTSAAAASEPPR